MKMTSYKEIDICNSGNKFFFHIVSDGYNKNTLSKQMMISHTGTETLPRLLREAAVGNFLPKKIGGKTSTYLKEMLYASS